MNSACARRAERGVGVRESFRSYLATAVRRFLPASRPTPSWPVRDRPRVSTAPGRFADSEHALVALLVLVLGIRLVTLGLYPLLDPSEARYAEIARQMAVGGDWITPWFAPGVPFWGKPPLSFWTQALSIAAIGVTEFAVRLPAWLMHVATCALMVRMATEEGNRRAGLVAAILYSSCVLGVVVSGVVLTDPALNFSVCLASYGFWRGAAHGDRRAALAGFVGLGLGLLAKGPLILVICGVPAVVWTLIMGRAAAWRSLPWVSGIFVMLAIAVPWYVLAEWRTPGFLDYFIVGEHWNRFLVSNWAGDRYGAAHAQPRGMIWLYLLGALLPWSLLFPLLCRRRHRLVGHRAYVTFLALSALVTPVLFTAAGNVLWTYVLPALPPLCLILGHAMESKLPLRRLAVGALLLPLGLLGIAADGRLLERNENQRSVVALWQARALSEPGPLLYAQRRSYASEFYSGGQVRVVDDSDQLPRSGVYYVALKDSRQSVWRWPASVPCRSVARASNTALFRCAAGSPDMDELAQRHAALTQPVARHPGS